MSCAKRRCPWWAAALTVLLVTGAAAAPWQDRPLVEVLEELRHGPLAAAGWTLVYSSELVTPDMRVLGEPEATDARGLLAQLLAPHGLGVEEGAEGVLVVVRSGGSPATTPGEGQGVEDGGASPRAPLRTVSDEIVVRPSRYSFLQDEPGAGAVLGRDEIERLPHLGDDPFRLATLLPGTAGSDVSARFSVRGGRRDEVRVVLDGLELYEPYHLRDYDGALSVVPARTLEGMSLTTGAYPASRGDRMSGVLDLRTLRPPELRLILGLGALDAFAAAGGRLASDAGDGTGGWLASGRLGSLALAGDAVGDEEPSFWDALAKVETPSPLGRPWGRFALRALATDDDLRVDTADEDDFEDLDNGWSSRYVWATHTWSGESWLVESLASSGALERDRRATVREEEGEYVLFDRRDVDAVSLSQEVSWQASPRRLSRAGWEARRYEARFDYAKDLELDLEVEAPFSPPRVTRHAFRDTVEGDDLALWVSHREVGPARLERLTAELGMRYDRHNASDSTVVSPRVNLAWRLGDTQLLRLAWGRFAQSQRPYELQVEDAETRLWPVERSRHWVLGYEALLGAAGADRGRGHQRAPRAESLRVELFHRRVANPRPRYESLLEPLNFFPEVEPDRVRLAAESSTAYGAELLLQGRWGRRARGFLSYTWSRSEDRIPGLEGGDDDVPRRFDQPHALVASADLTLPGRWHLSFAWRYHSGWPATPVELLVAEGDDAVAGEDDDEGEDGDGPVARFGRPYSDRLPDYHRLDLRASRRWPLTYGTKQGTLTFYVDVQNVYDRANLAGFDLAVDDDGGLVLEGESWPGVVPSLGFVLELGPPGR